MSKTIQSSTYGSVQRNTKDFNNFSYFLGGIDVTDQNLDQFTPYIRGVSRFFVHKLPQFMLTFDADMSRHFKSYIETGYTSIDGIGDITMEFTEFEGGFAGQRYSTVSMSRDETESITVQVYELTGSPIREYLDTWITGVRDPRSGIAHYHGTLDQTPYSERNHTMEAFYVNLDPTAQKIEYVAMFAHMMPTRVPKAHLNYEKGNHDNAQLDIEFRTTKYESPAINDIGYWYITNSQVNYNYLDFDPNINTNYKTANNNTVTSAYVRDYVNHTDVQMSSKVPQPYAGEGSGGKA